jgi:hypothetical protein
MNRDYCTYEELQRSRSFRVIVECWKKNIVECDEITDDLLNPKHGRRYILVWFVDFDRLVKSRLVVYEPGAEKEKNHPLVLAAYEKCLGVKTQF